MMKAKHIKCVGFLLLLALSGCSIQKKEDPNRENQSFCYYLNAEASKLIQKEYEFEARDTSGQVNEGLKMLQEPSKEAGEIPLLSDELVPNRWELREGVVWLDFNEKYQELKKSKEVLVRAGLVRMFTQISGVAHVGILIDGKELEDARGVPVGVMDADNFVEYSGKEVNSYQYVTMQLFFTDQTGTKLKREGRKIYYSKNMPMERVIIEQLIKGPQNTEYYPTIPPETKILGVTVMEGIAYVNLDAAFLTAMPAQPKLILESIVRSLTATSDINKVQISVNGDTKIEFMDTVSLDQFFNQESFLGENNE